MKTVSGIELYLGSSEERLPDWEDDFPYIASRAELGRYSVPWHWHKTVELFYVESGCLEYHTPSHQIVFPAGSGGLVNANVLHKSELCSAPEPTIQLLHIFDPLFLAGEYGDRITQKYILPILSSSLELIALSPDQPAHTGLLSDLQRSFQLSPDSFGYEMKLRSQLSDLWIGLADLAQPLLGQAARRRGSTDKIKRMMTYVHHHYAEKITMSDLAAAALTSQRECFRVFHDHLNMTPVEYIRSYRLQAACRMLATGDESITWIGSACGLGSSSYFGKLFREHIGCTPLEYRKKWQNRDT